MKNFEFKLSIGEVIIPGVPDKIDDWIIIKDEKYRPDKDKFILDQFKKDYPHVPVINCQQVYNLGSRSSVIAEWLGRNNVQYSLIQETPTYFRDLVGAESFKNLSNKIQKINKIQLEKAREEEAASIEYKNKIKEINLKYSSLINKEKEYNKELKVLTLNSTALPLTIQLAIENYVPGDDATSPDKKSFAREMLIRYKQSLINLIKQNPSINIDEVIDEFAVK